MLKIKNWKRNRSLPLAIYLLAGLFLLGVESAEAKKLTYERTEYCRNQVYVSNNQGTSLQVQPGDKASSIAQLHYQKYRRRILLDKSKKSTFGNQRKPNQLP